MLPRRSRLSGAFLALCTAARLGAAQEAVSTRVLVQDDFGAGVVSEVFVGGNEAANSLGETDSAGLLVMPSSCSGKLVRARPRSSSYYSGAVLCGQVSQLAVRVTRKDVFTNLTTSAAELESAGKYADAALVWSEVASRNIAEAPVTTEAAAQKVYANFAKVVGVEAGAAVTLDAMQAHVVMTTGMKSALEEWQGSQGVPVTGRIDYPTMRDAADHDVSMYLFASPAEVQPP
jgi:hypothetical protein